MPDAKWYANWVRMLPAESAPEKMRNLEAADLIETLAAELEQVKQERDGLSIKLTSATSAAETYKRERDAAVRELKNKFGCTMCTHQAPKGFDDYIKNDCMDCINFCNWQWRGKKEV